MLFEESRRRRSRGAPPAADCPAAAGLASAARQDVRDARHRQVAGPARAAVEDPGELAPSEQLRWAFKHGKGFSWHEFIRRFRAEMRALERAGRGSRSLRPTGQVALGVILSSDEAVALGLQLLRLAGGPEPYG